MWSADLLYCLEVMHKVAPNCLIEKIDCHGIIYTTCFHRVSLREFLDVRATEKEAYIKHKLEMQD